MTSRPWEDKRTKQLAQQLPAGYELPLIDGYTLSQHAALRMVVRHIEIDWVREALATPGRPCPKYDTIKYWGPMAMCVVDRRERIIITVGFGLRNGGVK